MTDLFLNELSLRQAADRYAANAWFAALGALYKAASAKGFGEIKVPAIFFGHAFAAGYTFRQWVGDNGFDRDLRTLMNSRITTTPVIEDMWSAKEKEADKVFECRYAGQTAYGLGAACECLFDTMAVSVVSDAVWDTAEVLVDLVLADEAGVQEDHCTVRHLGRAVHLDAHAAWLEAQRRPRIPNGQVLWLKRGELFPNLEFCAHVRGQIAGFSGNQPEFIQMQKRLFELEAYAAQRTPGVFDPERLPTRVTPESETRKRDFADELNRVCPDGITRLFDWHSRFTPGAWRLHFYPMENSNRILVGNIANQNEIK